MRGQRVRHILFTANHMHKAFSAHGEPAWCRRLPTPRLRTCLTVPSGGKDGSSPWRKEYSRFLWPEALPLSGWRQEKGMPWSSLLLSAEPLGRVTCLLSLGLQLHLQFFERLLILGVVGEVGEFAGIVP